MSSSKQKIAWPLAVFVLSMTFVPHTVNALSFTPSEREWIAWPDYCRARYVASGAGKDSNFANRVRPEEVAYQEARIGGEAWYWLHHHCAALAYLGRAAGEVDDARAEFWLKEAEVNFKGHYQRIGPDNAMLPDVAIGLAQVYRQRGDNETALRYLKESIEAQPESSSAYALAAMIYKDNGELDQALSILLQGDAALAGESAEIHYFLGHIYIDLDDLDSASRHADMAYDLGYPLPGLASKLRRLGRSED